MIRPAGAVARSAGMVMFPAVPSWCRLEMPYAWLAVFLVSIADVGWSVSIAFSVTGYAAFLVAAGVLLAIAAVLRRDDPLSRGARCLEVVALWLAFAHANNILSYLAVTMAMPLQEAVFARLDGLIGFDWERLFRWIHDRPPFWQFMRVCYASLLPEALMIGGLLAWTARADRLREFFWIAFITSLLTCAVSAALPALDAFQHYGHSEMSPVYAANVQRLRAGLALRFAMPDMVGIVTLPSYHAILAILMIYVLRGTGFIGRLAAVWNTIMVISVMPVGGHYFVDVLAGAALFLAAIAMLSVVVQVAQADRPATRQPAGGEPVTPDSRRLRSTSGCCLPQMAPPRRTTVR